MMTVSRKHRSDDANQAQQTANFDPDPLKNENTDPISDDAKKEVQKKDEFEEANSPGDQDEYGYEEFTR